MRALQKKSTFISTYDATKPEDIVLKSQRAVVLLQEISKATTNSQTFTATQLEQVSGYLKSALDETENALRLVIEIKDKKK